ncbi:MAG: 50S ribosomal protein L28 [Fibromonadaceae bacterium]|jgi:large subunit ribosomal protein L28|nr:50S ribosomal protein L28 [Fibromonadaceae bacterium]
MSRICDVTGKKGMMGNRISHSNRKKKVRLQPNLHTKKFFIPEEDRWISLRVSSQGLRTIDKKGIHAVATELGI